jgi:hypothetical protein
MAEKQPEPTSSDFDAAEKKILEHTEKYRERYLSVKLSLYAGFFAFEGTAVAAGTFVAARSSVIAPIVIGISLVAMLLLFLSHHWFLRKYVAIGYEISIKSQSDLHAHLARLDKSLAEFSRLMPWWRFLDFALFVLVVIQILLLILATW